MHTQHAPLPFGTLSFRSHVMAVNRVEQRLRKVSAALDRAGVAYAVIGGNA